MKIAEKKAVRASNESLETAVNVLKEQSGLQLSAVIDYAPTEAYDYDALGKKRQDVLGAMAKVPVRIVQAITEIAKDEDYREAFGELQGLTFVPAEAAKGDGFDYDTSARLEGDVLEIAYAPLAYMHGGYERSIKNVF